MVIRTEWHRTRDQIAEDFERATGTRVVEVHRGTGLWCYVWVVERESAIKVVDGQSVGPWTLGGHHDH